MSLIESFYIYCIILWRTACINSYITSAVSMKRMRVVYFIYRCAWRMSKVASDVSCSAIFDLCVGLFKESYSTCLDCDLLSYFLIIVYFELCSLQVKARQFQLFEGEI